MKKVVAYYRVSTQRQGKSGLGLDAQKAAVKSYCKANGYRLTNEIMEIKSTRKYQVRLFEALGLCKKLNATLMVARLDRLGRDVEQIARLIKSEVEIIVTDNPHATRFTIHILAAVAEDQRQRISDTTREALQAARKRGVTLGTNGIALSVENKLIAEKFARKLAPLIRKLASRGIRTVRSISCELNRTNVPTFSKDGRWHPTTVHNLLKRLKEAT